MQEQPTLQQKHFACRTFDIDPELSLGLKGQGVGHCRGSHKRDDFDPDFPCSKARETRNFPLYAEEETTILRWEYGGPFSEARQSFRECSAGVVQEILAHVSSTSHRHTSENGLPIYFGGFLATLSELSSVACRIGQRVGCRSEARRHKTKEDLSARELRGS